MINDPDIVNINKKTYSNIWSFAVLRYTKKYLVALLLFLNVITFIGKYYLHKQEAEAIKINTQDTIR